MIAITYPQPSAPAPGECRVNPSTGAATCTPLDNSVSGLTSFIRNDLSPNVDEYMTHSDGLNQRVANYSGLMTPEQLEAAIAGYTSSQEAGWEDTRKELESGVFSDGAELLKRLGSEETLALSRSEREELLELILDPDNPQAQLAILSTVSNPRTTTASTLDRAISHPHLAVTPTQAGVRERTAVRRFVWVRHSRAGGSPWTSAFRAQRPWTPACAGVTTEWALRSRMAGWRRNGRCDRGRWGDGGIVSFPVKQTFQK